MEVLARIAPVFALVGVGVVAARCGVLGAPVAAALSRYVFWVAFPALLIHLVAGTPVPGAAEAPALFAYLLAILTPYLLAWGLARARRWSGEVTSALPLLSGANNDAFMGLPLVAAVGGVGAASAAAPLVALNWALVVPFGVALLHRGARGGGWGPALLGAVRNPVTAGALVGLAAMLLLPHAPGRPGWPPMVETILAALAASSTPVALVALGVVTGLEGLKPEVDARAPVLAAVGLRLLVAPAAAWLALTVAGADHELRFGGVVLAACPTAVTGFIQAGAYGQWSRAAAQTVVLTTLVSAATLSVLLLLLAHH